MEFELELFKPSCGLGIYGVIIYNLSDTVGRAYNHYGCMPS